MVRILWLIVKRNFSFQLDSPNIDYFEFINFWRIRANFEAICMKIKRKMLNHTIEQLRKSKFVAVKRLLKSIENKFCAYISFMFQKLSIIVIVVLQIFAFKSLT